MSEKNALKLNGYLGIIGFLIISVLLLLLAPISIPFIFILVYLVISSFVIVQPNEAKVLTFFGTYIGVIKVPGFWLTVPFSGKKGVTLRVVNFNSEKLKVNDLNGNPIEIAAVVAYRVKDSAKAILDVENYESFVQIQSEMSIRHIASQYPYDAMESEDAFSLRKNSDEVAEELQVDLTKKLNLAGVEVIEARIMHLAYSSEIAAAMLQKQQAQAILSARKVIVEGSIELVESAIEKIEKEGTITLSNEEKARMVNNLLIAIVSDKGVQPTININQ